MHKSFLLLLLALGCRPAFAQTYVQLNLGGGAAKQLMSDARYQRYGFGPAYNAGIAAGVIKGHWQLEAGLKYQSSSAAQPLDLIFEYQIDPVTGQINGEATDARQSERYRQIFLPVKVGYQAVRSGRFTVTPFAGLAASCNYSHQKRLTPASLLSDGKWHESGYIGNPLVRFSAWGGAGAEAAYSIGKKLSVTAGPEAWYMLNSFSGSAPVKQHMLMLGLNAGVRCRL